jgi:hypothetical protein
VDEDDVTRLAPEVAKSVGELIAQEDQVLLAEPPTVDVCPPQIGNALRDVVLGLDLGTEWTDLKRASLG